MLGLELPSSPIAEAALSAARDDAHPSLFNHSVRSYWHARLIAQTEGVLGQLSEDLLFAATMLHDMGAGAEGAWPRTLRDRGGGHRRRHTAGHRRIRG